MANLKIDVADRFTGQATSLSSHIGIANRIVKEKLTERQIGMFRRTMFGRFMDTNIIFNSPRGRCIAIKTTT